MTYNVTWVTHPRDIPQTVWDACFRPPAERKWWYQSLQDANLDDQFTFYYGVVSNGTTGAPEASAAVGIVPVFLMDVPMELVAPPAAMRVLRAMGPLGKPFLTQRTLFVGNVAGEGGAIGAAQSVRAEELVPAIHAAVWELRRKLRAKLVVWKDFPTGQSGELATVLAELGYFRIPSYPATLLSLPAGDGSARGGIEAYLKALDGDYRYKLRKKLKAGAALPLVVEHLIQPTAGELAEIWGLFWQTYEHGTTKFERFNPKVFDNFAAHPGSHWVVLRREDDRRAVAFMLLTEEGDHWVNRFIGLDYGAPKELFLYYRLFVEAVGVCTKLGATADATSPRRVLLSGQTGYRAKLELGHELLPMDNFTKHRNVVMHWVYERVGRGIDWSSLDAELAVYLKAHPEKDASRRGWGAPPPPARA